MAPNLAAPAPTRAGRAPSTAIVRPQRVFGVDFSAAKDAGQKIWIAAGAIADCKLRIECCAPAVEWLGETDRDPCLAELRDLLARQNDSACGLDFPFGLPAALTEADSWEAMLAGFACRYADAEAFRDACRRAANGRELKRATDRKAKTPFSAYNLRLFRQTFHGLRDVLAPLVAENAVAVPPMQCPRPRVPWLIEICPASTLRCDSRFAGKGLDKGYKGREIKHAEKRQRVLSALEETGALVVTERALKEQIVDQPGGDALDSVIAAYATARAVVRPDALGALPCRDAAVEGWVFV